MMAEYFLKLALLLPILAALIWGSLRLTRIVQSRLTGLQGSGRSLELVETSLVAPGLKLAIVRFHDREILIGCSRAGIVRLGEAEGRETDAQQMAWPIDVATSPNGAATASPKRTTTRAPAASITEPA
ncbi:flagellar biogenesis protein [Erythrobacter sp.]|jgi:flagellar protein FliO/FliZ|uniref:flagellar biogenesis protein n=1 Tax=Erythrobacter sp. TaxID=1042 RepID=UPI002E9A6320|nr:flagellar biogenesis protein [Erythrobacter sp.]